MIENHRKLMPSITVDHVAKATIYERLLRNDTTAEAKKSFRRPPYYKTVAEVKRVDVDREESDYE